MSGGVIFRPARAGRDEPGIAAVHWAARRLAYAGLLPPENLDGRTVEVLTREWIEILKRDDGAQTLVAGPDERILGFVTGGPVRARARPVVGDLSGVTAEVSLLYVLPEEMGKGLGRALFGRSVGRLAALGHRGLVVWGYRANPFLRFYERLGGLAAAESDWEVAGRLLPTLAYVWRDLPALVETCKSIPASVETVGME